MIVPAYRNARFLIFSYDGIDVTMVGDKLLSLTQSNVVRV